MMVIYWILSYLLYGCACFKFLIQMEKCHYAYTPSNNPAQAR